MEVLHQLQGLVQLQHLDLSNNRIDIENSSIISALKENKELFQKQMRKMNSTSVLGNII